jgi:hypothetical protein
VAVIRRKLVQLDARTSINTLYPNWSTESLGRLFEHDYAKRYYYFYKTPALDPIQILNTNGYSVHPGHNRLIGAALGNHTIQGVLHTLHTRNEFPGLHHTRPLKGKWDAKHYATQQTLQTHYIDNWLELARDTWQQDFAYSVRLTHPQLGEHTIHPTHNNLYSGTPIKTYAINSTWDILDVYKQYTI